VRRHNVILSRHDVIERRHVVIVRRHDVILSLSKDGHATQPADGSLDTAWYSQILMQLTRSSRPRVLSFSRKRDGVFASALALGTEHRTP